MGLQGKTAVWAAVMCGLALVTTLALGQAPKGKKPKPGEATPAAGTAQVRIWKDLFASDRAVKLALRQKGKIVTEARVAEGRQFLDYQEVPAGVLMLEVTDEADSAPLAKPLSLTLNGGSFYTLLLQTRHEQLITELIDDTAPPERAPAELTVRVFAPKLVAVQIRIAEDLRLKLEGPAPFAHVRGLPRRVVQVDTTGLESGGKESNWANEIDFKQQSRATLLILPDVHGRLRPRVVSDGVLP